MDVSIRDRASERRCPYCHALVTRSEDGWVCASCGTTHHEECFRELGRCAVHGCSRTQGTELRSPCSPPAPVRRLPRAVSAVAILVGAVVVGGVARRSFQPEPVTGPATRVPADAPPTRHGSRSRVAPFEDRARGERSHQVHGAGLAECHIFTHDEGGNLHLYDLGRERWTHVDGLKNTTFSEVMPGSQWALVGTPFDDDRPDLAIVNVFECRLGCQIKRPREGWRAATLGLEGLFVLVATTRGCFEVWDARDGSLRGQFHGDDTVTALAVSPDGTVAVSGTLDGLVQVWNLYQGRRVASFPCDRGEILALRYPRAGMCVVGASTGGATHVFELELAKGTIGRELSADSLSRVIALDLRGQKAVSGRATGDMFLFDLDWGTVRHLPETCSIESASFSADGTQFVTTPFGPGPLVVRDSKTGSIDYTVPVE